MRQYSPRIHTFSHCNCNVVFKKRNVAVLILKRTDLAVGDFASENHQTNKRMMLVTASQVHIPLVLHGRTLSSANSFIRLAPRQALGQPLSVRVAPAAAFAPRTATASGSSGFQSPAL